MPEKSGANRSVKIHYKFILFWWVADIELAAFNAGPEVKISNIIGSLKKKKMVVIISIVDE